jgi:hypothetical protein
MRRNRIWKTRHLLYREEASEAAGRQSGVRTVIPYLLFGKTGTQWPGKSRIFGLVLQGAKLIQGFPDPVP